MFLKNNIHTLFLISAISAVVIVFFLPYFFNTESEAFSYPYRIFLFLFSVYILFINFKEKNYIGNEKIIIIYTIFWSYYILKAIYSFSVYYFQPDIFNDRWKIYAKIFLVSFIPSLAIITSSFKKINLDLLFKSSFYILLFSLLLDFTLILFNGDFGKRDYRISIYYISLGHLGTTLILLSLYYLLKKELTINPIFTILGVFLGAYFNYISASRSAFLALSVCGIILFLSSNKKKLFFYFSAFIAFIILLSFVLLNTKYQDKTPLFFVRLYQSVFEGNAAGRGELILKSWNNFLESPFFGTRILLDDGMYPHNIFLELLMATGILGFAMYSFFLWKIIKTNFYIIKNNFYRPEFLLSLLWVQYFILTLTSYTLHSNFEYCYLTALVLIFSNKISFSNYNKLTNE